MKLRGFVKSHRRRLLIGCVFLGLCAVSSIVTVLVIFSTNSIRQEYSEKASNRDKQVKQLSEQVGVIQKKLDAIPERTAEKTADKVKTVVKEDEKK